MQMLRFDFHSLQDFRMPPKVLHDDLIAEAEEFTPPPPPPPPTFSQQELDAARANAREEGRKEGVAEGIQKAQHEHAQRDAAIHQNVGQMVAQLDKMHRWQQETMRHQCTELAALVRIVARKVAGDAMALLPEASVEQLVKECLNVLIRMPEAVLHVHPDLHASMQERVQEQMKKLRNNCVIEVIADASLAMSDGRIEWRSGHAERSIEALWAEIEQKLASTDFSSLASAPQDTAVTTIPSTTPSNDLQQGESV